MRVAAFRPDAPFLPSLAKAWLAAPGDPSEGLLILPNRRSARALAGAFLQANKSKALLLPRIIAIGAIDEAALTIAENLSLRPAVSQLSRQTILAKLILARNGRDGAPTTLATAWALAADLANLLDEADLAEISLRDVLPGIVSADLAAHWQKTLEFLEIITEAWPAILADMGLLNPMMRQNLLIDAQREAWERAPPLQKIWLVVREANPALQRLAKTIAKLARGAVIFPGYDTEMTMPAWDSIDDTHPQKNIISMLTALGAKREEIELWGGSVSHVPLGRAAVMSRALLPAASLAEWQEPAFIDPERIYKLEAQDEHDEATAIAMALRDALETPDQTVAFITPDRGLALAVSSHLRRFGITADDSAGDALAQTPPAIFLRLLCRAVSEEFAPVPLLALLKHPLSANGEAPELCREHARGLEVTALRGPRPTAGFAGLKFQLTARDEKNLLTFLERLELNLAPIASLPIANNPADAVTALIKTAENLTATHELAGAERLWGEEAGLALSDLMADIIPEIAALPDIVMSDIGHFLDAVLAGSVVRRPRTKDGHPRVAIWGIQEANLQTIDYAVLGGLVEGVWPEITESGPWMSRLMRKTAGLPSGDEKISASANDFFSLCCQTNHLVLSHAKRRGRAPAVPARWLTRLDVLLRGHKRHLQRHAAASWALQIDLPKERLFRAKPMPRPAVNVRPTIISITEVATLINDPYAIYLTKILKLRALKDLDEESDAGLFGNIVHAGLAEFFADPSNLSSPNAADQLNLTLQKVMRRERLRPALENWWDARLKRIAHWVIEAEIERRETWGRPVAVSLELSGEMQVAKQFILKGRADRLERRSDGSVFILDYKTGVAPDAKDLRSGTAPQLPLEAFMAESGAFGNVFKNPVTEIAIWKLSGGRIEGTDKSLFRNQEELRSLIDQAAERLPALLHKFADPATAYLARPHPDRRLSRDLFDGISRRAEWIDNDPISL